MNTLSIESPSSTKALVTGSYAAVRESISDGDLVYIRDGDSIWSKLTQFVTRSPHFHVGIAFWMTDPSNERRLFILEAHTGGRRIVSLSSYSKHAMDVLGSPIPFSIFCSTLISNTGEVGYSIPNYIAIGLYELFAAKVSAFKGEVCSETVSLYLNQDSRFNVPRLISPGKQFSNLLSGSLASLKLQVRLT